MLTNKVFKTDLWKSLHEHVFSGLLAPVNITTEVIGDKVKVYWKDHNQPELVSGAYAAVSEVDGDKLGSPVFIHAEDVKAKSITLSGLMPQMTYSIRVCIYLNGLHHWN